MGLQRFTRKKIPNRSRAIATPGTDVGDFAALGFEDIFGGGDRDYNDANFQLEGGIGNVSPRVPEPASLILVVVGMSGLGLVSRTLFAVRCRENDRGALR
jgi:hypothetical protein